MEEVLRSGSGVISDTVARVPLVGKVLGSLLEKIGLGVNEINALKKCDCEFRKMGYGLYLEPVKVKVFFWLHKKLNFLAFMKRFFTEVHPLSNFEIIDVCKRLNIKHFKGVFMRDEL